MDRVGGEGAGQVESIRKVGLASFIGTTIEWYDYFIFGTAPPHSPPTPKPWMRRSTTSRTGAQMPMVSWVGNRPTRNVAMPIVSSVKTSIALRPILSP